MPLVASLHVTPTLWCVQVPLVYGVPSALIRLMPVGAVLSTLTDSDVVALLPTLSVQVPVTACAAPIGPVASAIRLSAGTLIAGGVVSRTVTVKLALPVLAWASVAEQFTVVVPSAKVEPEAGLQLGVSGPSTMSAAEALNVTAAPAELVASVVMFAGTVTAGGVVSRTVTLKEALPVLRWASVALQTTVVVAIAKVEPEARLQVTATAPSTMSLALAL